MTYKFDGSEINNSCIQMVDYWKQVSYIGYLFFIIYDKLFIWTHKLT